MVVVIFIESNFVILQHLKGFENYPCDKTQTRGRRCLPKTFVSFYICECQIKSKVGTTLGSQRSLQSSLCKRKTNDFLFEMFYMFYHKYYFENDKRRNTQSSKNFIIFVNLNIISEYKLSTKRNEL